ncbi:MAG: uroporphyrinogen decarboxylase [Candidatus Lambdaproteobacteria bacterium]|nr:uroporphyrinogen decarboxylase [Candidatus Lambdaproteobacteria bacterium]
MPRLDNDLLLRAVNHEALPRVPVWMMRQAGRSDPAYLAYREQVGLSLHELFRSAEHAVRITMLPARFGVDALILYQDILTPLAPMGADFTFSPGPVLAHPVRSTRDIDALRPIDPAVALPFVAASIRGVLDELRGAMPLLGFAGAPFTLAAFLVEGRSPMQSGMARTLALAEQEPAAFGRLMDKLSAMTIDYLSMQADAGVHAVQLFESVGDAIPRPLYERFAQPSHQRILAALTPRLPTILFVKGSPFPALMLASGAAVLSVSEQTPLRTILDAGQRRIAVQGNVDNRVLAHGTPDEVRRAVLDCLRAGGGRGHILNLNHGLLAETPFANVQAMVDTALDYRIPA